MAMIVTIETSGVPHVLVDEGEFGEAAKRACEICVRNPVGVVVWTIDDDGERPLSRCEIVDGVLLATSFNYLPQ